MRSIVSIALLILVALHTWSCKKAPDTTPPGNVTNLQIVNGIDAVTLTWNDPSDADFARVEICYYAQGGMACFGILKGIQSAERTGLQSGVEYLFVVKTIDEAGNKSAGVSIAGNPDFRTHWTGNYLFTNYNRITVAWLAPLGDTTYYDTIMYYGTIEIYQADRLKIIYAPDWIEPDLTGEVFGMWGTAIKGLIYPSVSQDGIMFYPGIGSRYDFSGRFSGVDSVTFTFDHACHSGDESYRVVGIKQPG